MIRNFFKNIIGFFTGLPLYFDIGKYERQHNKKCDGDIIISVPKTEYIKEGGDSEVHMKCEKCGMDVVLCNVKY